MFFKKNFEVDNDIVIRTWVGKDEPLDVFAKYDKGRNNLSISRLEDFVNVPYLYNTEFVLTPQGTFARAENVFFVASSYFRYFLEKRVFSRNEIKLLKAGAGIGLSFITETKPHTNVKHAVIEMRGALVEDAIQYSKWLNAILHSSMLVDDLQGAPFLVEQKLRL